MKKLIATLLMIGITVLIGNYGFQDDESGLTKLFAIVMLWTFFFIVLIGWTFVGALLSRKKAAINGRVDLTIQEAAMAKVALRDGTISASLGFLAYYLCSLQTFTSVLLSVSQHYFLHSHL
jgi:hypothetical protein